MWGLTSTEATEKYRRLNSGEGEECEQPYTSRELDLVDKYPSFLSLRHIPHGVSEI